MSLKINPRKLFLIDCLGAVLSTLMHGVVLVMLEKTIGMPAEILYILAGVAFTFSVFSFFSYWNFNESWRMSLKIIAIANLLFCLASMGLMIYLYQELTWVGILYFSLEIIVVSALVVFELKVAHEK